VDVVMEAACHFAKKKVHRVKKFTVFPLDPAKA
jgi:hypothetical protein